jgi:hypothetical protein
LEGLSYSNWLGHLSLLSEDDGKDAGSIAPFQEDVNKHVAKLKKRGILNPLMPRVLV